jgi:hypothetical protein
MIDQMASIKHYITVFTKQVSNEHFYKALEETLS